MLCPTFNQAAPVVFPQNPVFTRVIQIRQSDRARAAVRRNAPACHSARQPREAPAEYSRPALSLFRSASMLSLSRDTSKCPMHHCQTAYQSWMPNGHTLSCTLLLSGKIRNAAFNAANAFCACRISASASESEKYFHNDVGNPLHILSISYCGKIV